VLSLQKGKVNQKDRYGTGTTYPKTPLQKIRQGSCKGSSPKYLIYALLRPVIYGSGRKVIDDSTLTRIRKKLGSDRIENIVKILTSDLISKKIIDGKILFADRHHFS
jgi:hypothetical protein